MAWNHDTSSTARGYGAAWQKLRRLILQRDHHLCIPCTRKGRVTIATQVDHIKPKAKGGTDDDVNLQSICDQCHVEKTAKDEGKAYSPRAVIGQDGWPIS